MNNLTKNIVIVLFFVGGITSMNAQGIASSLGLYVFPANNQDTATQEADEMECFKWAKQQTGYDPLNPTVYKGAEVDRSVLSIEAG